MTNIEVSKPSEEVHTIPVDRDGRSLKERYQEVLTTERIGGVVLKHETDIPAVYSKEAGMSAMTPGDKDEAIKKRDADLVSS